jgi:hypothetical protein
MPRTEINYNNCIIYKIQHQENPELIYIGFTTAFDKRKSIHKTNSRRGGVSSTLYGNIRENGGWDKFTMVQIKEFPCKNTHEANAELDKLRREMKAKLHQCSVFKYDDEAREKRRTKALLKIVEIKKLFNSDSDDE